MRLAYLATALAAPIASTNIADAQVTDGGPLIGTLGYEDAVMEAAREGSGSQGSSKPRQRAKAATASNDKTRKQCTRARGWANDGMRHARLTRVLGLCLQAGL